MGLPARHALWPWALLLASGCASTEDLVSAAHASVDAAADAPDGFIDVVVPDATPGLACLDDGVLIEIGDHDDHDRDGWSMADGDCNDCDANANPGAYDVPGNGIDEDCSGQADDEPQECDQGLAFDSNEAMHAARALGLCRTAIAHTTYPRQRRWGVLSAAYVKADGTDGMHFASHGLLPDFGPWVRPQQGVTMLALSSASARRPFDPGFVPPLEGDMSTSAATPSGWPKDFPACEQPQSSTPVANDSAALRLRVRVPTNARALSFRFNFYTTEFPAWVCHQYNDYFVVLLTGSQAPATGLDGNICYDAQGNAISVNSAFLEACVPQVAGGKSFACALGTQPLVGTGFEPTQDEPRGHAATGWLQTSAPVAGGEEIELLFAIWDAGDHLRGSTVLLDDFRWQAEEASEPGTVRVPSPK